MLIWWIENIFDASRCCDLVYSLEWISLFCLYLSMMDRVPLGSDNIGDYSFNEYPLRCHLTSMTKNKPTSPAYYPDGVCSRCYRTQRERFSVQLDGSGRTYHHKERRVCIVWYVVCEDVEKRRHFVIDKGDEGVLIPMCLTADAASQRERQALRGKISKLLIITEALRKLIQVFFFPTT